MACLQCDLTLSCVPVRYTLPGQSAAAAAGKQQLVQANSRGLMTSPICFELFTINPALKCQPYRYSYGASLEVSQSALKCHFSKRIITSVSQDAFCVVLR